jgi:hypothetical protein
MENYLTTYSAPYFVARAMAGADTSVDLTAEGDFAQLPSDVLDLFKKDIVSPVDVPLIPESKANGICFIFAATAAHSKNIDWRLLSWRNSNGPAEIVANGTAETGTQAVVKYPHNGATATNAFWCDNIAVTNEYWMKEIEATATGGNSISKLFLDTCGYRYWKMEITLPVSNPATLAACFYGLF